MDLSNVTVLLARQRSGTNALRDVLDSHPQVFCLPEVFQSQPSPKARHEVEANYFNFLDERRGQIKSVLTSEEAQEALFLEYLAYLDAFSEKPRMVVDIKYNSAHNVDAPWRDLAAELFDSRTVLARLLDRVSTSTPADSAANPIQSVDTVS